ncbi:MAG TPA: hypothetical protein PK440_16840 [Candidatus Accumulibacter phosphatis]|nr:MAG: hypothetical protein AW07_03969 [Candidatus Accumulibacter sp. SK-11]HCN70116.1 hypothetical protein [Accumulibacter sp.]HRL77493.1 hypothetical protein [Candidatus Accumulibacter phosphatis]HRQ96643.1 hypothetical protein [Candidatus Accumulibacter phosphatis]
MKAILRSGVIAVCLLLAACVPGPEKAGELTRVSMQEYFRYDPQFRGQGIEVLAVRVTGGHDKQLEGVATIRHAGQSHEVPVIIVLDRVNLAWFAQPGGLAFLARSPADADRKTTE